MKNKDKKFQTLFAVSLATLLFTVFRRIVLFTGLINFLVERGWALLSIQVAVTLIEFLFSGIAVIGFMPFLLNLGREDSNIKKYLKFDFKGTLLGIISFTAFSFLGIGIATTLGIYRGDFSVVFARPDIQPEPDVVGWGYFILALVPGIWEELAFRGLIMTRLQNQFKTGWTIFLGSVFFALFHLSNLDVQHPSNVIGDLIMAFLFGLAWGLMKTRTGSVVPTMISHYLVDSLGAVFLNVDAADSVSVMIFFLSLTLAFTVVNILITKFLYPSPGTDFNNRDFSTEMKKV